MLRFDLDDKETKICKRIIERCYDEFKLGAFSIPKAEPDQTNKKTKKTESDKEP